MEGNLVIVRVYCLGRKLHNNTYLFVFSGGPLKVKNRFIINFSPNKQNSSGRVEVPSSSLTDRLGGLIARNPCEEQQPKIKFPDPNSLVVAEKEVNKRCIARLPSPVLSQFNAEQGN